MQNQIGADLGFTVVHVNRVLRSLRDERMVNLEKHCVTIGLGGAVAGDATSSVDSTVPLLSTRSQPQVTAAAWSTICW
jgi:hypothetical protein